MLAKCQNTRCKKPYPKQREHQRFCSIVCRYEHHNDQKAKRLKKLEKALRKLEHSMKGDPTCKP
jgi:hypothetical protein